jgi:hypothetical protein
MATDHLEGFRPRTDQDDENERLVRSIRGLSEQGIDHYAISDVIASQDILDAINGDTILAKLVTHCAEVLKVNMYRWSVSNEPGKMQKEHLDARAARMVVDWIESIKQTGEVAQQIIEQQDETTHDE